MPAGGMTSRGKCESSFMEDGPRARGELEKKQEAWTEIWVSQNTEDPW